MSAAARMLRVLDGPSGVEVFTRALVSLQPKTVMVRDPVTGRCSYYRRRDGEGVGAVDGLRLQSIPGGG